MTTRDEAIDACLASTSWRRADCAEVVDDRIVGGVYCDGTIVLDASGKRCVSAAMVAQHRAGAAPIDLAHPPPLPPPRWAVPLVLSLSFRALCALSDALGAE